MAVKTASSVMATIALLCFCFEFDVAKCKSNPGPYDTTIVYTLCSNDHFQASVPYSRALAIVINELLAVTPNNGFDYYATQKVGDSTAYGHAACNGIISQEACGLCLNAAYNSLYQQCNYCVGAQIQLKDCRIRYENYFFTE